MTPANDDNVSLTGQVGLPPQLNTAVGEDAWIDVIQQMDEIYADLVRHQIDLEDKNQALETAHNELQETHDNLKVTQQQLVQAEKMASLGRLIAGVAHELNNPISFILGNSHALDSYNRRLQAFFSGLDVISNPQIKQLRQDHKIDVVLNDLGSLVEGTQEGAQRVDQIVSSLLRFTAPQRHRPVALDLCQMLHTAAQWVGRSSQHIPKWDFCLPEHCVVQSYESPIHQILVNLLQNSVDALENTEQAQVWIHLEVDEKHASITVRDNGHGIEEPHLKRVFDPFFTTKKAGKGTGLGLYMSYLLATEHCGGLLYADNHPQGGAEFTLRIPLAIKSGCTDD